VDRLIAVVGLRVKLEARAISGSRGRTLGLLLALPVLLLFSGVSALAAFWLVRLASRTEPELLLPVLSALATLFGVTWALSPLIAGIAATETYDLTRLLPYPVPLATLVLSTLVANLLQLTVIAQLAPLLALALALGGPWRFPFAFAALALGLLLVVAVGQTVGLLLHALSRNRRLHDRAVFLGIGLGIALSVTPVLVLSRGGGAARRLLLTLLERDVFALSPFAWSARAAVHAGRGEWLAALAFCGRRGAGARGEREASPRSWRRGSTAASSTWARPAGRAPAARASGCRARSARSSRRSCASSGATRASRR
jgi:hypothetical protein